MTVLRQNILYQPISQSRNIDNRGTVWWVDSGQLSAFSTIEQARKRVAEEISRYDDRVIASGNVRFIINQITTLTVAVEEIEGEDITVFMLKQDHSNVRTW